MYKIKLFGGQHREDIEEEINAWLEEREITIIQMLQNSGDAYIDITILYQEA